MKQVKTVNFKEDNKIFYITTEKADYRANNIHDVLMLWHEAYDSGKDTSRVKHVGAISDKAV